MFSRADDRSLAKSSSRNSVEAPSSVPFVMRSNSSGGGGVKSKNSRRSPNVDLLSPSFPSSSLASSSSHLLSALASRPRLERVLNEGLELHSKIQQIETTIEQAEEERVKRRQVLQDELNNVDLRRQEILNQIRNLDKEANRVREDRLKSVQCLRQSPSFLDRSAIERLSHDLHQLDLHAEKMRSALKVEKDENMEEKEKISKEDCDKDEKDKHIDETLLCPVCLTVPSEQIFSCVECDNMVCGTCLMRVVSCPSCRKGFKSAPPRRNRLAERLIASQLQAKKKKANRLSK